MAVTTGWWRMPAKSPLVKKLGSPDQFHAGLTVSYSFGFGR